MCLFTHPTEIFSYGKSNLLISQPDQQRINYHFPSNQVTNSYSQYAGKKL